MKKIFSVRNLPVFLILLLSLILRLYKAEELFIFSGDEEHQLSLAYSVYNDFHLEWVGVSSADTGFYLGPFWIYFSALWLFLGKGSLMFIPYIPPIIGTLTTSAIFITARKMFKQKVALMSSFLYAVLPLTVFYDKKFWNPTPTSLSTILLLLFLFLTKRAKTWWIAVFAVFGFAFHVHLSVLPFGIIIAYLFLKDFRRINLKIKALSVSLFLLLISSILAFDFFTKGTNTKTPQRLIQQIKERPDRFQPIDHIQNLTRSLSRLWYIPPNSEISDQLLHSCNPNLTTSVIGGGEATSYENSNIIFVIIPVISFFWLFSRKENFKKFSVKLLMSFIAISVISYIFLPNIALEYYLFTFFPISLIALSYFWSKQKGFCKIILNVFIILTAILAIFSDLTVKSEFGFKNKALLVKEVSSYLQNEKYELSGFGLCHRHEGWRLLSGIYGKLPERSDVDKTLGWIYKDEITDLPVDYGVVYAESRAGYAPKHNLVKKFTSGGLDAYVYKN